MAYEYDRFEKEEGGGSFLMGLLAGTVLGAGLGMLFAPKAGNELRSQIGEQAGRLRTTANDAYGQATDRVNQIVDRGREAYDRARTTTGATGGDSGTMSGSGSTGNTGTTGSPGSSTYGNTNPNYSTNRG
jgi:gas vesicle protein